MLKRIFGVVAAVAAVVAMSVSMAVPAQAGEAGGRLYVNAEISVSGPGVDEVTTSTLRCKPVGGTHANRVAACREIDRVDGQLAKVDREWNSICTREYAPILVRFSGVIGNDRYSYEREFGNPCIFADSASVLWQI
ncbi:SSI family serine proteinase inhibitor [Pilimelia columellifera]|uniref:Protease inhibitor n=1 Tax=Pilimelia columellifera subsp. columellifera TaxID=706583 RepID=A0ABP6AJP6_9ACTN